MTGRSVPVLPSRDLTETAVLYQRLGFQVTFPMDDYLIADRDGAELHFFPVADLDPATSNAVCYLQVDDADALHLEWAALGVRVIRPLEDKPWGLREFALVDDSGNLIRVASLADPTNP
jgi:catechol 2,3-dioxygenase-like lactoylglutathione lyase family enzyme